VTTDCTLSRVFCEHSPTYTDSLHSWLISSCTHPSGWPRQCQAGLWTGCGSGTVSVGSVLAMINS